MTLIALFAATTPPALCLVKFSFKSFWKLARDSPGKLLFTILKAHVELEEKNNCATNCLHKSTRKKFPPITNKFLWFCFENVVGSDQWDHFLPPPHAIISQFIPKRHCVDMKTR